MAIRFRWRLARRGRVRAPLEDATVALTGTSAPPVPVTGRIETVLDDTVVALVGESNPPVQRNGIIVVTLDNVVGNIAAQFNTQPSWVTAAGLTKVNASAPFSYTLTATDTDGDALLLTRTGTLPAGVTQVINAQVGNSRSVTIASSGGLPAGNYTFTYNVDDGFNL